MRSTIAVLSLSLLLATPRERVVAQDAPQPAQAEPWTSEELENLLAPIALYPDPVLAQVLIAATFPEQIALAAAYVRVNGTTGIDEQPWEISVKAVAHYPPVLNLMAEGEDWTIALGQAYASQSGDVMGAVQSLRRMANAQGNLVSTSQQEVIVEAEAIKIIPAQPKVIYVPTYDPAVIYFRPVYVAHAHPAHWSWGIGYPIGVWLTYDFDWYSHRIYYHGWHGPHWVVVSRPWIVISPIYVAPRHTVIVVNRRIGRRHIDYHRLSRYSLIHRTANFDRRRGWDDRRDRGDWDRGDRRGDDRGDRNYDRRDNGSWNDRGDRNERRDGADRTRNERRAVPLPTRGDVVPQPRWSSSERRGGGFASASPPTRSETRPTAGTRPGTRVTPTAAPSTSRRTIVPPRTSLTRPTPSRSATSAAPSRPTTNASPSRSPTRTTPRAPSPRRSEATPSSSPTRRTIVPAGRAGSKSANAAPRSSSGSRSTPRTSSGNRSTPRSDGERGGGRRGRP